MPKAKKIVKIKKKFLNTVTPEKEEVETLLYTPEGNEEVMNSTSTTTEPRDNLGRYIRPRTKFEGYLANWIILGLFIGIGGGICIAAKSEGGFGYKEEAEVNRPDISGVSWYPELDNKIDLSEDVPEVAIKQEEDVKLLYEGISKDAKQVAYYTAIWKVKTKKWCCVITSSDAGGSTIKVTDRTPTRMEDSIYDVKDRELYKGQVVTGIGQTSKCSDAKYLAKTKRCTEDMVARLVAYYF